MNNPTLILLTTDSELESVAHIAAALACCGLVVGRNPEDGARVFARSLDSLCGVVVDLDSCAHGSAWLTTMTSQSRKLPGLAISRLDPRFLRPLARRYGVKDWLSKPVGLKEMVAAFRMLTAEGSDETREAEIHLEPVPVSEELLNVLLPCQSAIPFGAMKPREFSIYSGTGVQCALREEGVDGSRCFRDISQAIDFILALDPPPESMLTAYNNVGLDYRIPLSLR